MHALGIETPNNYGGKIFDPSASGSARRRSSCLPSTSWVFYNDGLSIGAAVREFAICTNRLILTLALRDGISGHEGSNALPLDVETNQGNTDQIVGKGLIYGVSFAPRAISTKSADCLLGSKKKA
jgi:hypothetical protein